MSRVGTELPYLATHVAELRDRAPEVASHLHLGTFAEDDAADERGLRQAQERLTDRIVSLLAPDEMNDVLDVGCGFGGTLATLDGRLRGARLVGVDIGPRQLEIARRGVGRSTRNRIELHLADAISLPFADESFDGAIALESPQHFADRAAFLRELTRVLRAGGRVALTDIVGTEEGRRAVREGGLPAAVRRSLETDLVFADPFSERGTIADHATEAGLRVDSLCDVTASTLRTFDVIFHGKSKSLEDHTAASDRGAAALEFVLARGLLRVELMLLSRD